MPAKKILIVEDDADIREILTEILCEHGYDLALAENGQEALNQLSSGCSPNLILLDCTMPVMDGGEFLRARSETLTETTAQIPIILMSATRQSPTEAKHAEVKAFVAKPMDIDSLLKTIELYATAP